jgi:hypothetical protein
LTEITFLEWDNDTQTLFFSDQVGTINAIPLTKARSLFFSPEFVYKCDSSVVQLSCLDNQLLASSETRCVIINFAKHTSLQIGSQLRDGKFGACFHPDKSVGNYMLAARPGKRLWLADCDLAEVRKTLSFKDSLSSEPIPLLPEQFREHIEVNLATTIFSRLVPINNSLVLAWETNAIFLIDLTAVDIPEWHTDITNIQDIAVFGNVLFILHGENKHVAKLTLKADSKEVEKEPSADIIQQPTEISQPVASSDEIQQSLKLDAPVIEELATDTNKSDTSPDPIPNFTELNEQFPEPLVQTNIQNKKTKSKNKKRKPSKIPVILSPSNVSNPPSISTSPSNIPRSISDIDLFKASETTSSSPTLTHKRSQSSTLDHTIAEEPKKSEEEKELKSEKNNTSKPSSVLPIPLKEGLRLFASKTRVDQFTNFIKDPFISEKKAELKPEVNEGQKSDTTQEVSAFFKLTKTTHEALSNYR